VFAPGFHGYGAGMPAAPSATSMLRVVSVPSAHPYVEHLAWPGAGRVVRLPDVIDEVTGQWYPPAQLTADWVREHVGEFDVVHVHFGIESFTPPALQAFTRALDEIGVPLVVTVHDLVNPHLPATAEALRQHRAQLGVLLGAASVVFTLTPGAAAEIKRVWRRDAVVIAHPHVIPFDYPCVARGRNVRPVVGMHLKSLRANTAVSVALALADSVGPALDVEVRVDLHDDVADSPVADALRARAEVGRLTLQVHPRFTDCELWNYLAALDICVLAYAWGSHSGWLEACWDVGTAVVAPDCGFYAEQHPVAVFETPRSDLGPDALATSLLAAVSSALEMPRGPDLRTRRVERARQRQQLADIHEESYLAAIAGRVA
jgi:hypothetical protein